MDRLFPLFLLLGVFTSCTPKYEIEGCTSLSSLDGRMLYIKTLNNGNWEKVDSAEVIHGSFCMTLSRKRTPWIWSSASLNAKKPAWF